VPDVLGTAYIDVVARLQDFEKQARTEAEAASKATAEEFESGGPAIAGAFAGTSEKAGKSLDEIGSSAEKNAKDTDGAFAKMKASTGSFLESAGIPSWSTASKLGIAALAGESINLAAKFQDSTVALSNQAGISESAAASIGKSFLATAGDSTFSAQTMLAAYTPVSGVFRTLYGHALDNAQALTVMRAASDLAEAGQVPLADATSLVAKNMLTFHLSVSQASQVSDVLFNTSRALGVGVDDLGSTFQRLAPKLAGSGTSLAQVGALMVVVAKQVGTGKAATREAGEALQNLVSPSAAAQKALDEAGITLVGSNGKFVGLTSAIGQLHDAQLKLPGGAAAAAAGESLVTAKNALATLEAEKQTAAVKDGEKALQLHIKGLTLQASAVSSSSLLTAVFGKQAGAMAAIVSGGVPALNAATAATSKSGTASAAAGRYATTFAGTLRTFKATILDVGVTLGQQLLPAISALLKGLLPLIKAVVDFVGLLVRYKAVITPVVVVIAAFLVGLKAVALAQAAWTKVQALASSAMAAFRKSTDEASAATKKQGASAGEADGKNATLQGTLDRLATILERISGSTEAAAGGVEGLGTSATAAAAGMDDLAGSTGAAATGVDALAVSEDAGSTSGGIFAGVMDAISVAMDANPIVIVVVAIAALAAGVYYAWTHFKAFRDVVEDVGKVLKDVFLDSIHWVEKAFSDLVGFLEMVWDKVSGFIKTWGPVALLLLAPMIAIPLLIYQHFSQIVGWLTEVWHDITGVFTSLSKDVERIWTVVIAFVEGLVTKWIAWQVAIFTKMWHETITVVTSLWHDLVRLFTTIFADVEGAITTAVSTIEGVLSDAWNAVLSAATSVWNDVVSTITSIFSGVESGVEAVWDKIASYFTSGVNSVLGIINSFIGGIDSILKDLHISVSIPKIPLMEEGGLLGGPQMLATGGWFNKPTAIVGEGRPGYPEVVIPTDPAHRKNALALYAQAGTKLLAGGGWLGDIEHATGVSALIGGVRDVTAATAGVALRGLEAVANSAIGVLPDPIKSMAKSIETTFVNGVESLIKGAATKTPGSGGVAGASNAPGLAAGTAQVKAWIDAALNLMKQPLSFEPGMASLIMHESGGNPFAINNTDSNAKAGHPSQGLTQTIPSTYAAYVWPALANSPITDPVANITAGFRYALANYGAAMIQAGGNHNAKGQYIGYAAGGVAGSDGGAPNSTDVIPAWLADGEFVLTADAVKRVGLPSLYALNGGMGAAGALSSLGGPVGGAVPAAAAAFAIGGGVSGGESASSEAAAYAAQGAADAADAADDDHKKAATKASSSAKKASTASASAKKKADEVAAEDAKEAAEKKAKAEAAAAKAAKLKAEAVAKAKAAAVKAAELKATAVERSIEGDDKDDAKVDDGTSADDLLLGNLSAAQAAAKYVAPAAADLTAEAADRTAATADAGKVSSLDSVKATQEKQVAETAAVANHLALESKMFSASSVQGEALRVQAEAAAAAYKAAAGALALTNQQLAATQAAQAAATEGAAKMAAAYGSAEKNVAQVSAALKVSLAPQVLAVQQAFATSVTANSDLGSLFDTSAGYGAETAASVIAQLKYKVAQAKSFGTVLQQLAAKGLDPTLLSQLAQAGPQAGLEAAQQLLDDPASIATIDALEGQLASASQTATGNLLGSTVAGQEAVSTKLSTAVADYVPPGTPAPAAASAGASLMVQGDLVVRSDADIAAIGQQLFIAARATQRATGASATPTTVRF
jgi:phage-related protein